MFQSATSSNLHSIIFEEHAPRRENFLLRYEQLAASMQDSGTGTTKWNNHALDRVTGQLNKDDNSQCLRLLIESKLFPAAIQNQRISDLGLGAIRDLSLAGLSENPFCAWISAEAGISDARMDYNNLRDKRFDPKAKFWHPDNKIIIPDEVNRGAPMWHDDRFYLSDQLHGMLLEEAAYPGTLKDNFTRLEASPFRDSDGVWRFGISEGNPTDEVSALREQLILILVQARVYPEHAKDAYETLKKSDHFCESDKEWILWPDQRTSRHSALELYGLLIDMELDKHVSTKVECLTLPNPRAF